MSSQHRCFFRAAFKSKNSNAHAKQNALQVAVWVLEKQSIGLTDGNQRQSEINRKKKSRWGEISRKWRCDEILPKNRWPQSTPWSQYNHKLTPSQLRVPSWPDSTRVEEGPTHKKKKKKKKRSGGGASIPSVAVTLPSTRHTLNHVQQKRVRCGLERVHRDTRGKRPSLHAHNDRMKCLPVRGSSLVTSASTWPWYRGRGLFVDAPF